MEANEFNHAANPERPSKDQDISEAGLYQKIELYEKLSVDDGKAQALLQKEREAYGDKKLEQADREGKQNVSLKLGLSSGVQRERNIALTERNHQIQRQENINQTRKSAKEIYHTRVSLSGKFAKETKGKDDVDMDMEK